VTANRPKLFKTYNTIQLRVEEIRDGSWRAIVYDGHVRPGVAFVNGMMARTGEVVGAKPDWMTAYFPDEQSAKEWAQSEVGPLPDKAEAGWRDQSDMPEEDWQRLIDEKGYKEENV
jgi:hypothetical protein